MGSIGPRFFSHRRLVAPVVGLLQMVTSRYAVSYTLGLMKPPPPSSTDNGDGGGLGGGGGPTVNDLFQVWAVLIVTLRDSSRIGQPYTAYSTKNMTLVDLLSSLWSANQLRAQTRLRLAVPLWLIWSVHALRIIWYNFSWNRATEPTKGNVKLVSDYMLTSPHTDDEASPATMQGYRYIVSGEEEQTTEIRQPGFTLEMEQEEQDQNQKKPLLITVDRVWNQDSTDRLLGSAADGDNRFKDVCLSFALYKLQRRRFYDCPIAEAAHPATGRLVSGAILEEGPNGNYERAFRITGLELSFLHDFFYSRHPVVFARGFPYVRLLLSVLMAASVSYLFYAVGDIPSSGTAVAGKRPEHLKITHGVLLTYGVIAVVLCRELIEVVIYVFSQWTKVRIVCYYVSLDLRQRQAWVGMATEKLARAMFWIIRRGQWDQRTGQYNLLMAMLPPPNKHPALARFYVWCRWPGIGAFIPRKTKLQKEAKRALFQSLKNLISGISSASTTDDDGTGHGHSNPSDSSAWSQQMNSLLTSYFRNAFTDDAGGGSSQPLTEDADAVGVGELVSETHKILVWHIATSLCQIKLLQEEAAGEPAVDLYSCTPPTTTRAPSGAGDLAAVWPHYVTTASLSNYCAYLVTQALVPDNGLVVNGVFGAVCDEVRDALRLSGCTTVGEIPGKLSSHLESQAGTATMILGMGERLSNKLVSSYRDRDDRAHLWERLAKFWAGFLLHLSASTAASKHRIYLQGCGELNTHLWLLLSHAGFLGTNIHGEQLLDPVDLNNA